MHIIPVIDLRNGQAVHARLGQRNEYQPLHTELCPSPDPIEAVRAYLSVYHFDTIYLADLDAIERRGSNQHVIDKLHDSFPLLNFWLDAGFTERGQCLRDHVHPIMATETGIDCDALAPADGIGSDIILSLDFSDGKLKGDETVLANSHVWPENVIVMSLRRVGSERGPDLDLLRDIQSKAPAKNIFAAGGIRHGDDLERLAAMGISGALLASALHNGQIDATTLQNYHDTL